MKIPLSLLRIGQQRCIRIGSTSVLVCRTATGIYAVENRCTHVDSALYGGALEGDSIRCPLHGIKFDLRTGEPFTMGRMDNLRTYKVILDDECVTIVEH